MLPYHIYYVSTKCGAGKSYGACYIKHNLFRQDFVYVAPSFEAGVLDPITRNMRTQGPPHNSIPNNIRSFEL